ncbi:hypothetical protein [Micromonospora parastrephiae]|uniref:hypothetical protein n=1 Tax=Micromonospora parastrephiae TaxID=2806101 RepID=UPI001EE43F14|nr:hypothetical protein [Micromonospora parastrephiae]
METRPSWGRVPAWDRVGGQEAELAAGALPPLDPPDDDDPDDEDPDDEDPDDEDDPDEDDDPESPPEDDEDDSDLAGLLAVPPAEVSDPEARESVR